MKAWAIGATTFWTLVVLFIIGLIGYVWNIIKLVDECCGITGMLVARAIGVFVGPLGAVLGFF